MIVAVMRRWAPIRAAFAPAVGTGRGGGREYKNWPRWARKRAINYIHTALQHYCSH